MSARCLVIGVGKMGLAHLRAISAIGTNALAGWAPSDRRRESVEGAGAEFFSGPLVEALESFRPSHVVIASPVETLIPIALQVMTSGVRHLLIEKPVAISSAEGREFSTVVSACGARVCVGYNRRFYASIRRALQMIEDAGEQIESVLFEFNEVVSSSAGPINHAPAVRARWLLANSLHVIDSALFPVGLPNRTRSYFSSANGLDWHPAGGLFVGAGETVSGVPFAYHANWAAPGRWGVEWMTPSARYVFRPLEMLSVMKRGSFSVEEVPLDDDLDRRFKPGVYLQDRAFLAGDEQAGLVMLDEALALVSLGEEMAAYSVCAN